MMKFKITYFDEIEATDEVEAKEFLLQHLERDVEFQDVSCFEISKVNWVSNTVRLKKRKENE